MATENLLSQPITNRDSIPAVKNNAHIDNNLKEVIGRILAGTGDLGSTYRFGQIPSNARVSQLLLYSADMGTTGLADFGLYQTTENGSAVVDADFFASAVDMKAAALNGVDITHESGIFSLANAEKQLWEALGLAADPCIFYDVVATTTEAFQAAGNVVLKIRYV